MIRRWRLAWEHGNAEVHSLGGMLGPVSLSLGDERELDIMHVAPWASMIDAHALPGVMRRLRGEWPCVPFGRTDLPPDLPPGWSVRVPDDSWDHGYSANHHWDCLGATPHRVHLGIDYPATAPVSRIERVISVDPERAALEITLTVWSRRPSQLPVGLHPTFRLPAQAGRIAVSLGTHAGIVSYPTSGAGAFSRLRPDTCSANLDHMAGIDGVLDLSRLPLDFPTEELMQVKSLDATGSAAPFMLHYLDYEACVGLWWDRTQLPDLMLWLSGGGRPQFPWMGRHLALGAEPVNSLFDLGRVATAPPGHPLAERLGVLLDPGQPWQTRYRIAAWTQPTLSPL